MEDQPKVEINHIYSRAREWCAYGVCVWRVASGWCSVRVVVVVMVVVVVVEVVNSTSRKRGQERERERNSGRK